MYFRTALLLPLGLGIGSAQPTKPHDGSLNLQVDPKTAAHDVRLFADAAAQIKKLNDAAIEDYKARLKANGKDPLGPGNAGVIQMYLDESKKWRTTAELAQFNLDRGKIREAVFSLKGTADAQARDYIRSLAISQRLKPPTPMDAPHVQSTLAKLRVASALLGRPVPEPVTPEWILKQGGF